jgi:signal transduction histidine kinase
MRTPWNRYARPHGAASWSTERFPENRSSGLAEDAKMPMASSPVIEDVAALVVHDLRTSLGVISNVLKTCRVEPLAAYLPDANEIVDRQIKKSLRMAEDLLSVLRFSGAQPSVEHEPVSLTRIIVEIARDLDPEMRGREQSLSLELARDEVWTRGDSLRLGQVLTNILENASKYSRRGGRIWLSIHRVERLAEIRVRDNGLGIDSEDLQHIFEPYFRSRSSRSGAQEGNGLGLALARRLVELHGGTIEAKSDGPGLGTEFTVRLSALT